MVQEQGICPSGYHRRHGRCVRSTRRVRRCPTGKILRAAYARKFGKTVRAKGYDRKLKSGNVIHIVPKKASTIVVPAACIKDRGKKGKGTQRIGPLRTGALKKYGYSASKTREERQRALRRAIGVYGLMNVYHKLDAVAKLTVRTSPKSSRIFSEDRDWVHRQYGVS
jgi:hypothetical protein